MTNWCITVTRLCVLYEIVKNGVWKKDRSFFLNLASGWLAKYILYFFHLIVFERVCVIPFDVFLFKAFCYSWKLIFPKWINRCDFFFVRYLLNQALRFIRELKYQEHVCWTACKTKLRNWYLDSEVGECDLCTVERDNLTMDNTWRFLTEQIKTKL